MRGVRPVAAARAWPADLHGPVAGDPVEDPCFLAGPIEAMAAIAACPVAGPGVADRQRKEIAVHEIDDDRHPPPSPLAPVAQRAADGESPRAAAIMSWDRARV